MSHRISKTLYFHIFSYRSYKTVSMCETVKWDPFLYTFMQSLRSFITCEPNWVSFLVGYVFLPKFCGLFISKTTCVYFFYRWFGNIIHSMSIIRWVLRLCSKNIWVRNLENDQTPRFRPQVDLDINILHIRRYQQHCKKYLGVLPRFTKKKVALSPPLHTFAVSSGNFLVA